MLHSMDLLKDVKSFSVDKMPVILRSTDAYGDIVAIDIASRGGVSLSDKPGAIELLLRSLHSGTPHYSKEQIDRIFTESGAAFSVDARSDYIEVSIKCLKRFLPQILPIVSEMLLKPSLTSEEVELSRQQLMSELKSEHDHPDSVLSFVSSKSFFKGHPYLKRASGYLETVPGITRTDIVKLLPKIFNKENVVFTFIGDLNSNEVKEIVNQYFQGLPEGASGKIPDSPIHNEKVIDFEKFEAPTTYFMARFKAPNLGSPDYPALVLATQILENRLFEEIRTKRALTYAVSSSIGNSASNSGVLYVTSTQLPEAVKIMFKEVKKLQNTAIPNRTLKLQVRKFTASWYLSREQSSSQAKIISLYEMIGPGWKQSNSFIDRLNKVTPAQIEKVSKMYLKDYTVTVVGPAEVPELKKTIPGFR